MMVQNSFSTVHLDSLGFNDKFADFIRETRKQLETYLLGAWKTWSSAYVENLAQLEALCEGLYNSQDSAERAYAENSLRHFSQDPEFVSHLEYVLENAKNSYANFFASSSLLKHVAENRLSLQLPLQIRDFFPFYSVP